MYHFLFLSKFALPTCPLLTHHSVKLNLYTRNPIPADQIYQTAFKIKKLEFKRVEKTHVFWEDCFLGSIELIHI